MSEDKRWRIRRKAAANPVTDIAWRVAVGVLGGAVTALGVIALIGPGPGWLIVFIGLGILASEFAWAERALFKAKMAALQAKRRALSPALRGWLIAAVILLALLIALGVWLLVR